MWHNEERNVCVCVCVNAEWVEKQTMKQNWKNPDFFYAMPRTLTIDMRPQMHVGPVFQWTDAPIEPPP